MSLSSPLWLLGLVPLAMLLLWMLRRRPPSANVPFLQLWSGTTQERTRRRQWQSLPLAVWLTLLAMALSLTAAAGPAIRLRGVSSPPLEVIVDRGASMSARLDGRFRFAIALHQLKDSLNARNPNRAVHLTLVPRREEVSTTVADLDVAAATITPVFVNDDAELEVAVSRRHTGSASPLLVLTDQPVGVTSGVTVVAPEGKVQDVGISLLAFSESPARQLLVRMLNQSDLASVKLEVLTSGQTVSREVALPPRGSQRNYFFDLPAAGPTIAARIESHDDFAADDQAWLALERAWPHVESKVSLDSAMERMLGVYPIHRPASPRSPRVSLVNGVQDLPADQPGVVLSPASEQPGGLDDVAVIDHAITRLIDWKHLPLPAGSLAPAGWTVLVRGSGGALVAIKDGPPRQAWVAINSEAWSRGPEFVIFWTNLLDWVGAGSHTYAAHPMSELTDAWKPIEGGPDGSRPSGLYSDGEQTRAFNVEAPVFGIRPSVSTASPPEIAADSTGSRSMRPECLLAALGIFGLAATFWPRSRPASP